MADPMRLGALLLLVGTALCAPLGSAVGTHSLHYNLTVRSQGGSVQSRSCAKGYWDHQLFRHFDSDKKESVKPQGPWAEKPLGTENWDTEIQELAEHRKNLKATLADINAWQEQKGGTALMLPSQWAAFLGVAAAVGVLIMIIVCVCSCKKRKTKSTTEGSGVHPVRDLDCDHNNAKEQKMGLQFTLQNLSKTLVFFGKKTSEDCEDCGLQKSLLGMEEGSPGKPQENETLGEELGSQP
ncbi:RT1 class I histocompatibility antigen, AA alpha chain-like isoform X3 [Marmota monax]|uniref:RT1 class I histocompatibility antigen, AA alpha chain-like isoform X3 n=1 Tax=Marmota monax TaxID=9995 RepID=UPI0026EC6406|nr:RT1 class I histocompatibility antigen, AA alpha chain-like isoform X3 [Marmota monax]